jgi:hypothetical protein
MRPTPTFARWSCLRARVHHASQRQSRSTRAVAALCTCHPLRLFRGSVLGGASPRRLRLLCFRRDRLQTSPTRCSWRPWDATQVSRAPSPETRRRVPLRPRRSLSTSIPPQATTLRRARSPRLCERSTPHSGACALHVAAEGRPSPTRLCFVRAVTSLPTRSYSRPRTRFSATRLSSCSTHAHHCATIRHRGPRGRLHQFYDRHWRQRGALRSSSVFFGRRPTSGRARRSPRP